MAVLQYNVNELLPIGSVVLLKGGEQRVMIIGRYQVEMKSRQPYDYTSCLYPQGFIAPDRLFMFNHDQIERVYFIGFQDETEFEYRRVITEKLRQMANAAESASTEEPR